MRPSIRTLSIALSLALLAGCEALEPITSPSGAAQNGGNVPAAAQLDGLVVADEQSMSGYKRSLFSHWRSAGSNCDVRDTVLERDGKDIELDGCNVVGGEWYSRYDGETFTDPGDLDIDHMVPLANAWRSGAGQWNDDQRDDFANDLDRPQLFAVSASSNRSKGDQGPHQWKPDLREDWCQYAQDWIAVKTYWELTVTTAEKAALNDMLGTCL